MEDEPLIWRNRKKLKMIPKPYAIVINGDTLTNINYMSIEEIHKKDGNSLLVLNKLQT